jgi:hypothetical protein
LDTFKLRESLGSWWETQDSVRVIGTKEGYHIYMRCGQERMSSSFASPQDMQIMEEGKQVKEALGGGFGGEVVHLVGVAAQAAENVFSGIGGEGDRPAFGQGDPLLLGAGKSAEPMLAALQAVIENQ